MNDTAPLISAQQTFLDATTADLMPAETVALSAALGRVLHSDLVAAEDAPPYHRAIVEGFVVHAADTRAASEENPVSFKIVGSVAPGDAACPAFGAGEGVETQTGSIIPDGEVAIVRMWEAQRDGDSFSISRPFPPRFFIEDQGCDIQRGSTILQAGTVLDASHIGTLASLGLDAVSVSHQPRVTIFASGNEVIPHTATMAAGKIRDCNSPMLAAAVAAAGGIAQQAGIIGDDFAGFVAAVKQALNDSDMILISGGTAVGGRDFISDLIKEVGELLVDGIPMRSGRPLIMGMAGQTPIVAVAGHPPEALRGFRLFGAPALQKLMGIEISPPQE